MLTSNIAEILNDPAPRLLLLSNDAKVQSAIDLQLIDRLGVSLSRYRTAEEFEQAVSNHDAGEVLAIIDNSEISEEESAELFSALESQEIPTVSIYNRANNCTRVEYKSVIATLDRDKQLRQLSEMAEGVFKNRRIRVIILHRNSQHRHYLEELLSGQFYTVMQAADVAEAKEFLTLYPQSQILLLDEKFCVVDGIDVVETLRENNPIDRLAIIGMTVQRDPALISRLFESGASDVLTTSTDDIELLARIRFQLQSISKSRKLQQGAFSDYLTCAYSREYFYDAGNKIFASAQRGNLQLSFALVNIDNFNTINREYGLAVGNAVLCSVADQLKRMIRETDIIARNEGDEFLCLLSCVGRNNIYPILERVRMQIEKKGAWNAKQHIPLSVSIGATPETGASLENMQIRAEMALQQAKQAGKGRVEIL